MDSAVRGESFWEVLREREEGGLEEREGRREEKRGEEREGRREEKWRGRRGVERET